ncbi:MAG TPA: DUF45 domain-containing protein [Turneriella sp.]|nr:DUF45 domain-containing protein [Turneriella sp.]
MVVNNKVKIKYSPKRARTVALKLTAMGQFELSVPVNTTDKWIQNFLTKRQEWMQQAQEKAHAKKTQKQIPHNSRIETPHYSLAIFCDDTLQYPNYRVLRNNVENTTNFYLPSQFFEEKAQLLLHKRLEKYLLTRLMQVAGHTLIERAMYCSKRYKLNAKEFFVRVQKSRLGYCTHDDRIMLNARLLLMPQKLIDYVICHELAHTRHRNHSKNFWSFLETLYPNAKVVDRKLRDASLYSMPKAKKIHTPH